MTRTEVAIFTQRTDTLSKQIVEYSALLKDKITLLGINAVTRKSGPNNIPINQHHYFTFTEDKTPPEFLIFLEQHVQRLIAERLDIWQKLEKEGIKI